MTYDITMSIFKMLDERDIRYCIYNGYEDLPGEVKNDLDIAIEERVLKELDTIVFTSASENGAILLHKIWHDNKKVSYIISPSVLAKQERLQLDFFSEFSSKDFADNSFLRYRLMNENELLNARKKISYFYVPLPNKEFIMKLLRRIIKNDLNENKFHRLADLYKFSRDKCEQELQKYFPDDFCIIIEAFVNNNYNLLYKNISTLKSALRKSKINFLNFRFFIATIRRVLFRMRHPVGIAVAFLGPDGCGKSSIARLVMDVLSSSFHGNKLFYWRPELLKQPGVVLGLREEITTGANPNPHGHRPETPFKSLFRFSYYFFDYCVGYWLKVWPLEVKKHLCIFDRYYYDVLVDSYRYNFSLQRWLLQLPLLIIPKPGLTIILDVPVEKLSSRKQELPVQELRRQRIAYLKLAGLIPNAYIVDNNRPMDEVIKEITSIILLNKSYQTYFSLNLRPEEDEGYFAKIKKLFNIKGSQKKCNMIGFPKGRYPRVFLTLNNFNSFKSSLKLYTPSRPMAKFLYNNIPPWLLYPLLQLTSWDNLYIDNSQMCEKIRDIFPLMNSISISTGAPGPHRKPLVQVLDEKGKALGYIKMGLNDVTNALLEKEEMALNYIKSFDLETACVPDIKEKGVVENGVHYLAFNAIDTPFKKSYKITDYHMNFLKGIFEKTSKEEIFGETEFFKELEKRIHFLEGNIPYYWFLRYKRIMESCKNRRILIYCSHGDFTPWNAFINRSNGLLLFDWEYSRENIAFGDLFHFAMQSIAFARKKTVKPQQLLRCFEKEIRLLQKKTNAFSVDNYIDWLLIYLFEISSFYFERNFRSEFIEKDLRLEIMWSNLLDRLFAIQGTKI